MKVLLNNEELAALAAQYGLTTDEFINQASRFRVHLWNPEDDTDDDVFSIVMIGNLSDAKKFIATLTKYPFDVIYEPDDILFDNRQELGTRAFYREGVYCNEVI